MITYNHWPVVGESLKVGKYEKRYVTPEKYIAPANPIENLVVPPGIENFFGTKVLNILIVAVPYGWVKAGGFWSEGTWPYPGLEDAKARHIATYSKFTKYETHVFMDFNIVNLIMAAQPGSRFETMMDTVRGRMISICNDLTNYGWTMHPNITGPVEADFFYPIIDSF